MPTDLPVDLPLDLKNLIFTARIDFVTIATHGRIPLPPIDGTVKWPRDYNGSRLTIHDMSPTDLCLLQDVLGDAPILELEVAVDLRPRPGVPAEARLPMLRAVMVNLFAKQLHPKGDLRRPERLRAFYRRLEHGYRLMPFNKAQPSATDQQLRGHRNDDEQVKAYLKTIDQRVALSPDRYVARVETRLSGNGLQRRGLLTLQDLDGFKFRRWLTPLFKHVDGVEPRRRSKPPANPELAGLLDQWQAKHDRTHWDQAGAGAFTSRGNRGARMARMRFTANTPVNDRIGQALWRLEKSFRSVKFVCFDQAVPGVEPALARVPASSAQSAMTYQASQTLNRNVLNDRKETLEEQEQEQEQEPELL